MSAQEKADELIKTLEGKINAKPEGSKNWGGSIIINFQDAEEAYWIKVAMDGKVENRKRLH